MKDNELTDEECLRLIAQGGKAVDRAAAVLYRRYRRPVMAYFVRNRMDTAKAEDLYQETLVKVVRQAQNFRDDGAPAKSWIWVIARNVLIDHVRGKNPECNPDEDDWDVIAMTMAANEDAANSNALDDCVSRAFQEFSRDHPEASQALRLATQDGFDGESINYVAAFLRRTPGATRQFLSQCRIKFRPFLEPCRQFLAS